jgi:hypothetical protein
MTQLKQGKIPPHTECPFGEDCPIRAKGACKHLGFGHTTEFSCAAARAFDMRPSNVEIVVKESFVRACWPEAWLVWEIDNADAPVSSPRFSVRSSGASNILLCKGVLEAGERTAKLEWRWVPETKKWQVIL